MSEQLADCQKALKKLNKKFRLFKARHVDCKKIMFLYRWNLCLSFVLFFVSVFCCENHIGYSLEIINECVQSMNEFIEFLEYNRVEYWIKIDSFL